MENKFNVIIPTAYKDFSFLKKTITYVAENIQPRKIVVVLDIRLLRYIPKEIKANSLIDLVDENNLVKDLSFLTVRNLLKRHGLPVSRTGWFLQQFLKLGFALSELCDTDYYLSWDADTLPLRKLQFFSETGHPLFTKKKNIIMLISIHSQRFYN